MLKKVNEKQNTRLSADQIPHVRIADANFPAPFRSGLEYSSPARGTWNIVHTGMLIPEVHEIFVCAAGCLRGVVLTAAEMGTQAVHILTDVLEGRGGHCHLSLETTLREGETVVAPKV